MLSGYRTGCGILGLGFQTLTVLEAEASCTRCGRQGARTRLPVYSWKRGKGPMAVSTELIGALREKVSIQNEFAEPHERQCPEPHLLPKIRENYHTREKRKEHNKWTGT